MTNRIKQIASKFSLRVTTCALRATLIQVCVNVKCVLVEKCAERFLQITVITNLDSFYQKITKIIINYNDPHHQWVLLPSLRCCLLLSSSWPVPLPSSLSFPWEPAMQATLSIEKSAYRLTDSSLTLRLLVGKLFSSVYWMLELTDNKNWTNRKLNKNRFVQTIRIDYKCLVL